MPIASGGVVHGAVRITYPTSAVDARILRYWLILAAIGAVVLAAAALVGLVLGPLRHPSAARARGRRQPRSARATSTRARPSRMGPPEVRSLAAVFNETVAKLEQLLRSQDEFVADASHELRTPLTALRLRLENLRQTTRRDRGAARGRAARRSRRRPARARACRRGRDVGATVDAAASARERVEPWRTARRRARRALDAEVDGPAPARAAEGARAGARQPHRQRARGCARRYDRHRRRPHGRRWDRDPRRDEGPGLTAEQRERAFDRFWRAGSGAGGSGLGLAIVRRLVEADEGEVESSRTRPAAASTRSSGSAAPSGLAKPFRFAAESSRGDSPGACRAAA